MDCPSPRAAGAVSQLPPACELGQRGGVSKLLQVLGRTAGSLQLSTDGPC